MRSNAQGDGRLPRQRVVARIALVVLIVVVPLAVGAVAVYFAGDFGDRCKPPGWVEAAQGELPKLAPNGAKRIDVGSYADDCPVPNVVSMGFAVDGGRPDVLSEVHDKALANGWSMSSSGKCVAKRIGGAESMLVLDGGDSDYVLYVELASPACSRSAPPTPASSGGSP